MKVSSNTWTAAVEKSTSL